MICPDLATMLVFIVTDAPFAGTVLKKALAGGVNTTLNAITVDGDMSTNDIVLILSGGGSDRSLGNAGQRAFRDTLEDLLGELARLIVKDGEGATKLVRIAVDGAPSAALARKVCYRVANSPLVKTAFFGEDPNWGRIMAAVGSIDDGCDPEKIDISVGSIDSGTEVALVSGGRGIDLAHEERARLVMQQPEFSIIITLHRGRSSFRVLTSDLSFDYVKINAEYRS